MTGFEPVPPRDNSKDPTPYAVYCGDGDEEMNERGCGLVFLTHEQYMQQLRAPDYPWKCPKCGSCAEWDDDCQEARPDEKLDIGDMTCTPKGLPSPQVGSPAENVSPPTDVSPSGDDILSQATIINSRYCLRSLTDGRCSFPNCLCRRAPEEKEPPERELPGEEP